MSAKILTLFAFLVIITSLFILNKFPTISKPLNSPVTKDNIVNKTTADIGGAFSLIDTKGEIVKNTDFRGKFMLVYFGFTYCPDICPTTLFTISQSLNELGDKAKNVVPIFITIDPDRDDRSQLESYMTHFNKNIIALTGSKKQIADVANKYKVYFAKANHNKNEDEYLINHSGFVYLMDKNGKYITHFNQSTKPEEITRSILKVLK